MLEIQQDLSMNKIKFLDLNKQYKFNKNKINKAIFEVINDSVFIGGKKKINFENNFAKYIKTKFCLGVANGTDAIEIAIESLNLKKNSEIIVPSNSWISTSEAVTRNKLKVIFCDIDEYTYTIDIKKLEKLITKNTSAIIAVHLYGHPCEMEEILKITKKYKLKLIEDCAQAHGSKYKDIHVGNFGHISTFSFYPGKNIGAYGDAGAIVTNNKNLYIRCKKISNHGRVGKFDHELEGRNSRLDTIQASILNVKLRLIESLVKNRNKNARLYFKLLSKNKKLVLPKISSNVTHSFHLFVIRLDNRKKLINAFNKKNIEYGIHYPKSLPKLVAYKNHNQKTNKFISGIIDSKIISLPIHEYLEKNEIIKICKVINSTI